jgi:hypothetical protein
VYNYSDLERKAKQDEKRRQANASLTREEHLLQKTTHLGIHYNFPLPARPSRPF